VSIFDDLAKPFPVDAIHWRVGATTQDKSKGIALAYIDARNVMDRLDAVIGPENWQCRYPREGECEIGISFGSEWIWKANGAGPTDFEGEKGQYSDAFKRAAVLWGIGRYLYGLPNTWYDLDAKKRFKTTPKLPDWATPNGWKRVSADIKREVYDRTVEALANSDLPGLNEIWEEFDKEEQLQFWSQFNAQQRDAIKALRKDG
jgi:hypothetical protein